MKSFGELVKNEDWLADNFDKMVHAHDPPFTDEPATKPIDAEVAAKIEEKMLRCLCAAVMMHWSAIPTKLQRELFDPAGSMGDVLQTGEVKSRASYTSISKRRAHIVSRSLIRIDEIPDEAKIRNGGTKVRAMSFDLFTNDACPNCRKPIKLVRIERHSNRHDLSLHKFACAEGGAVTTRVLFEKQVAA
jgi:hypothetical protein